MFNPDSITPDQINEYRQAAENAWGEDTRYEGTIGHPQPSAGQCYVTSNWLTQKLGGHVGAKDGHFFWVSPDKQYVIDLSGDLHAHPPVDPSVEGMQLDEDDEPWTLDPHHKTWRPGPALYKRADHPLYKGFRIVPPQPDHQRSQIFARRADAALRGERVASFHEADLMGPSGLSTPQQEEDWDRGKPMPMLHDTPMDALMDKLTQEYKWVFVNGQLHVSPMHEHEELFSHAGAQPDTPMPAAVGYVTVHQGHAMWEAESNISMRGLYQILSDYTDQVGWKWDGLVGTGGEHIHDDFGPKKSMYYTTRKDGHLVMAESPLPHGKRIRIFGKTAYVSKVSDLSLDSLQEWAKDFGYLLKVAMPRIREWQTMYHVVSPEYVERTERQGIPAPAYLWADPEFAQEYAAERLPGGYALFAVTPQAPLRPDEEFGSFDQGTMAWISDTPIAPAQLRLIGEFGGDEGDEGIFAKTAEFPGGGDMTDKMKVRENLDTYNRGDTDFQPERVNEDMDLGDNLTCGNCGLKFDSLAALRLHHRDHEPHEDEIEDGHFPQLDDFDAPLPFRRRQPSPNWGETIATVVMPLPTYRMAAAHPRFDLYSSLFNYAHDDNIRFYGAYRQGQLVGYGAIRLNGESEPEALMIDAAVHGTGIGTAILGLMQTHFDHFYTHADSEAGERLMRRMGMVNVKGHRWRWAAGSEPKDMIKAAIPFIYDIQGDENRKDGYIQIGYPGQRTSDIQGKFIPGGIVEGYYEAGGKIILISATNMPYSVRHFANLWYHQFPQMEITSIEMENPDGSTQKLAAGNVGQYIKTLVVSDQAAQNAYQALRESGGKVYVVGGAVRDALRGQQPKDLDLMVAGLPSEKVAHILDTLPGRVDLTGKRFGVYRYRINGQEVEIALPRQDKYETSRRGEGVITVDHNLPIEKDLERRDFTANSMAIDLDSGALIDPYGGARDVQSSVLRTTHPDSFREDPTRIVRALAAHGRFGLIPDERTRQELAAHGHMLRSESPDALNKVIDKTLSSHNPAAAVRLAKETQVLPHLFPEVAENWDFDQNNPHHQLPLGEHLLNVLDNTSKLSTDPDVRMAALYHDVGKPASMWIDPQTGKSHYYQGPGGIGADHEKVGAQMVEDRMRALNYPTARIRRVSDLVSHHMFPAFNTPKGARKFLQRVGDHADDLLNLRQADMEGKGNGPEYFAARTSADKMRELVDQARREQAPTDIQNLAINGNDLITNLGMRPGPAIGQILRSLVDHVVDTPTDNNPERLLQLAQQYQQAQPSDEI